MSEPNPETKEGKLEIFNTIKNDIYYDISDILKLTNLDKTTQALKLLEQFNQLILLKEMYQKEVENEP